MATRTAASNSAGSSSGRTAAQPAARPAGRSAPRATKAPLLPPALRDFIKLRAVEVTGLILASAGLLLILVLLTYERGDPSWNTAVNPEANPKIAQYPGLARRLYRRSADAVGRRRLLSAGRHRDGLGSAHHEPPGLEPAAVPRVPGDGRRAARLDLLRRGSGIPRLAAHPRPSRRDGRRHPAGGTVQADRRVAGYPGPLAARHDRGRRFSGFDHRRARPVAARLARRRPWRRLGGGCGGTRRPRSRRHGGGGGARRVRHHPRRSAIRRHHRIHPVPLGHR